MIMDDSTALKLLEWEREENPKAPLTAKQRDVIMELAVNAAERPLPARFQQVKRKPAVSSLGTDDDGIVQNPSTIKTPVSNLPVHFQEIVDGKTQIQTAYEFFEWFSTVEENMVLDEDEKYRHTLLNLRNYSKQCDDLLNEIDTALGHAKRLQNQHELVSTKTNSLHEACEQLLAEQTRLVNAAEHISGKLSYFTEVEKISQKLSSPTLSVVNESFIPMLSRLDECIAFLTANSQYKESGPYLVKFHRCLSQALGLIHAYVVKSLQNSTQQVTPNKNLTSSLENAFTLFYGKFRTNAGRIKTLMEQIEIRVHHGQAYEDLLSDCHQCYFGHRDTLITPSLMAAIKQLTTSHQRDHCTLVRSGCNLLLHLCEDEHQLFFQFFSNPSDQLEKFLENLCQKLYDDLRPLIVHINHLETLAELCSILKIEMLEEHVGNNAVRLSAFELFVTHMLQDVQERLVFRSHVYVQTDILNYNPAPGDLAYPEKLQMMESIAESLMQTRLSRTESQSSLASLGSITSQEVAAINAGSEQQKDYPKMIGHSPADLHGMWYPTVRRTLGCLSKLYHCIDRTVFQGLSQEALSTCIQSLISAGNLISKKQTPLDGQLFQIKHMLILREQITPFQVDFSVKETALDFSTVKNAAVNLLHKRSRLFSFSSNNAVLEFIVQGSPQVTEHFRDSKKDVDSHLKAVCDEFISNCTTMLTGSLKSFTEKANVIIKVNTEDPSRRVLLRNQPFASAEQLATIVTDANRQLKAKLPVIQRSMYLYLANRETEAILFRPIKKSVSATYQQFADIVAGNYDEEDRVIISCPSSEQVMMMLTINP